MRCDAVRQTVEEGMAGTPAVQVHVESCSGCKEYLRKWEMLQSGLVAIRGEEPPEPSMGFTTRLMRRLENASPEFQFRQQLIDQIGRRVVYATLMVALMLALILALPSSGPFRSSGISESVFVQTQVATLANEQVLGVDGMDTGGMQDSAAVPAANGSPEVRGSK
jgi:hypothetical protein